MLGFCDHRDATSGSVPAEVITGAIRMHFSTNILYYAVVTQLIVVKCFIAITVREI